jgi:hypothetical protein
MAAINWNKQRALVQENYEWLIAEDVARELARIDLPLSTYTQWRWKIDGHNLMHFLSLRCDPHAQWEIRVFANIIAGILERGWPNMFEAWGDYNFKAHTFSRQEMLVLCKMLSRLGEDLIPKLSVNGGVSSNRMQTEFGLTKREADELLGSFDASNYQKPTFELPDPKSFEFFMEDAQAAVPKIDVSHA